MRMMGMQCTVGMEVCMDHYLVGVTTCTLPTMRDQISTHTHILVTPTMLHLDTLTANPTPEPFLQAAINSLHQQSKCYI